MTDRMNGSLLCMCMCMALASLGLGACAPDSEAPQGEKVAAFSVEYLQASTRAISAVGLPTAMILRNKSINALALKPHTVEGRVTLKAEISNGVLGKDEGVLLLPGKDAVVCLQPKPQNCAFLVHSEDGLRFANACDWTLRPSTEDMRSYEVSRCVMKRKSATVVAQNVAE